MRKKIKENHTIASLTRYEKSHPTKPREFGTDSRFRQVVNEAKYRQFLRELNRAKEEVKSYH